MPDPASKSEPTALQTINRSLLPTQGAATALGRIAAAQLWQYNTATFWLNPNGIAELLPNHEALADSVTEPEAVQMLIQRGYTQEELVTYLRGRDWRIRARRGE